ncbi:ATP-binding protein [Enterobacter hormaechei]|uniref:ATP-binding protein n=1 Tax=Enterobacter hormaechei TaxID=158836 RepID=UPI0029496745|nr:ATP-binding protein [Enterobacter hormaechei]MDV5555450.1 ATP-binding protein [Enterobacter hormaechei]
MADSGNLYLNRVNTDIKDEIDSAIQFSGIFSDDSKFTPCINIDAMIVSVIPLELGKQCLRCWTMQKSTLVQAGSISVWRRKTIIISYVQDEGPGIPDFLPHIFTPFMQAPDSKRNGSGLGLAVVSAIAKAHGGYATCTLSADGGTIISPCAGLSQNISNDVVYHVELHPEVIH